MKRTLLVIGTFFLIMAVFMGVKLTREFSAMSRELQEKANSVVFGDFQLSEVPDGAYEGSCDWGIIAVRTKVTVQNGRISAINILQHNNGRGKAAEKITESVLSDQTLQVDLVSGATYSSKAILSAIQDALAGK